MGAVQYRVRADLRRRWRAVLLLVVIVGLAGGVVLTTLAGARRSATAYDRFREESLAADLDIAFDGRPASDLEAEDAAASIRSLPQVEALTRTTFPFLVPADSGMYPYLDFLAAAPLDDEAGRTIDIPRVVEGRTPDPSDETEIAATETFAGEAGLTVGDKVEFDSFAPDQLEPLFTSGDAGPPAGPSFTLEVVGIVNAPTFLSESTGSFTPRMFLSHAFVEANGSDVATYPGGFTVRLHDGANDVAEVSEALRSIFGDSTSLELSPASEVNDKIASSIDVIVNALLLCALVAAVAGVVAIAQSLSRFQSTESRNERWFAALG